MAVSKFAPKSTRKKTENEDPDHALELTDAEIDAHADEDEPTQVVEKLPEDADEGKPYVTGVAKRQEIYDNAKKNRNLGDQGLTLEQRNNAAKMEAESRGEVWDGKPAAFKDDLEDYDMAAAITAGQEAIDGEYTVETKEPDDATVQSTEKPTAKGKGDVDTPPSTQVKITVYNETQYATPEEIDEAGGIEQLQKNRAGDTGLRYNATQRRINEEAGRKLDERKAQLDRDQEQLELDRKAALDLPPGGIEADVTPYETAAAVIYKGDPKLAGEALQTIVVNAIAEDRQKRGEDTPPGGEISQVTRTTDDSDPAQKWTDDEVLAVNDMFKKEFQNVLGNTDLRAKTVGELDYRRGLPENQSRPLVDLAREAGKYVQQRFIALESADIVETADYKVRLNKKRRSPARTAISVRKKSEEPDQKLTVQQSRSKAVASIKAARGQGPAQPG